MSTIPTGLTKAFLIYVPPQHDQYHRPYESNLNGRNVNAMLDATSQGNRLGSNIMLPVASSIIAPATTPRGKVALPNDFGNAKLAFFLEITTQGLAGIQREIVSGFTDYMGVSLQTGAIDPNMVFHMNSGVTSREIPSKGYGTPTTNFHVKSASILTNETTDTPLVAMRPEDVISTGQYRLMLDNESEVIQGDSRLGSKALMSKRDNTLPHNYLSTLCNGYISSAKQGSDSLDEMYNNAYANVRAPSIYTMDIIEGLGIIDANGSSRFTFGELNAKWPRSNDFWIKSLPSPGVQMHSPLENSEHWSGANLETHIAFSLTHVIPSIMTKLMVSSTVIDMNNMNSSGQADIVASKQIQMFNGVTAPMDPTQAPMGNNSRGMLDPLENEVLLAVVVGLLEPLKALFNIRIEANLFTNIKIDISLNGQPTVPYVAPMFCDSYYSPLVGLGTNELVNMNQSVETLVEYLHPTQVDQPMGGVGIPNSLPSTPIVPGFKPDMPAVHAVPGTSNVSPVPGFNSPSAAVPAAPRG